MKTIDEIQQEVAREYAEEYFEVIFETKISIGDYEQARRLWNEVGDRYIKQFENVGRRSEQLCRTFLPDGNTTSATTCQFCGKEKWRH